MILPISPDPDNFYSKSYWRRFWHNHMFDFSLWKSRNWYFLEKVTQNELSFSLECAVSIQKMKIISYKNGFYVVQHEEFEWSKFMTRAFRLLGRHQRVPPKSSEEVSLIYFPVIYFLIKTLFSFSLRVTGCCNKASEFIRSYYWQIQPMWTWNFPAWRRFYRRNLYSSLGLEMIWKMKLRVWRIQVPLKGHFTRVLWWPFCIKTSSPPQKVDIDYFLRKSLL